VGVSADSSPEDPAGLTPIWQIRTRSTTAVAPQGCDRDEPNMTRADLTHIYVLLYRGGSMQPIKTDIEGGLAD